MKWFLIVLLMTTFLLSEEIGRYQIQIATYTSKKGIVYVVEAVLDTKTGKIVKRKKIKASLYKLPYKDTRGRIIKND